MQLTHGQGLNASKRAVLKPSLKEGDEEMRGHLEQLAHGQSLGGLPPLDPGLPGAGGGDCRPARAASSRSFFCAIAWMPSSTVPCVTCAPHDPYNVIVSLPSWFHPKVYLGR